MGHASFDLSTFIVASPETVSNFLASLRNHDQIHPLIIRVQQLASTYTSDGLKVDNYLIRDRMKQGPFTIRFTYRVELSVTNTGEIVADAYQAPQIHLHNVTTCRAEGSGTRVQEHVEITAPRLVLKTTYQQGMQAHQRMFANLKKLLEAETLPGREEK